MRFLFVDAQWPMYDRASADVRMFAIVRLLRELGHDCDYFVSSIADAEARLGVAEVARYKDALRALGARTLERIGFEQVLVGANYDVVYFKYFYPAEPRAKLVRTWLPRARIVVDSVDLVYARLAAKAAVSKHAADLVEAEETKRRELAVYAAADLVLTVTEDEAAILSRELPNTPLHVIPNIHEISDAPREETPFPSLLFIGTFTHEPNVDGVLWFTREVWPAILGARPDARLRVIGGHAPSAIQERVGNGVEILGYVPDTLPYLMESWVSVAPLRFGAGMKGKVGEAMAAGLPVVATGFGAEGFGLTPGEHLLVADRPDAFAAAILSLLDDAAMRARIGRAGRDFIESRYSPAAVGRQLEALVAKLAALPPRRLPFSNLRKAWRRLGKWTEQRVLWRFR